MFCVAVDEDMCYPLETKGSLYNGPVSYTDDMAECLPWASTTDCRYSTFHTRYACL